MENGDALDSCQICDTLRGVVGDALEEDKELQNVIQIGPWV
jgi:sulfur relay (sulfurtransferase) complex TusBCD TusD component (DsrE family)